MRFGIRSLLVMVCVCALFAWFAGEVFQARRAAYRSMLYGHVYKVAFALRNYREDHGKLPLVVKRNEQGVPVHSWTTALLPYFHEDARRIRYDATQSWNSPTNLNALSDMPYELRYYETPVLNCLAVKSNDDDEMYLHHGACLLVVVDAQIKEWTRPVFVTERELRAALKTGTLNLNGTVLTDFFLVDGDGRRFEMKEFEAAFDPDRG